MGRPIKNIAGQRFGWITVDEFHSIGGANREALWLCHCKCGKQIVLPGSNIRFGRSVSCGCYRRSSLDERKRANG